MLSCELYRDQEITIRINGNIFYGPIKRLYQTYYNKVIEVFYNGNWYPAKIIGEAKEKNLYIIENKLYSPDLIIKTLQGDMKLSELFKVNANQQICINEFKCDKIISKDPNSECYIGKGIKSDEKSDWLFGVEFIDSDNHYFTMTNGMIVSTK